MAAKIESLRQQHDAAEQMAAAIMSRIASYSDEYDAIPIARQIGKLNVLLRVHFAYEDTILYPLMMRSGDGQAAALAHLFAHETGSLAPEFEDFVRRWSGPTAIHSTFERFREGATALFGASAPGSSAKTTSSIRLPSESRGRARLSLGFRARRRLRRPAPG